MSRFIRRWGRLLVGFIPVALVLAGCSSALGTGGETASQGDADAILTINVDITDQGIQPSPIRVPKGQLVQLVVRNRGQDEHHFRVQGMAVKDLMWVVPPMEMPEEGAANQDHAHHMNSGFAPFRDQSPQGIKPTGQEVHAWASGRGIDVILFTATKSGTFTVKCPLHPSITAKLIVS